SSTASQMVGPPSISSNLQHRAVGLRHVQVESEHRISGKPGLQHGVRQLIDDVVDTGTLADGDTVGLRQPHTLHGVIGRRLPDPSSKDNASPEYVRENAFPHACQQIDAMAEQKLAQ